MSYLCYVPEDALGQEHMTLIWCGRGFSSVTETWVREVVVQRLSGECPFQATVFAHDVFMSKPVALVNIPHAIHALRENYTTRLDRSGRGLDWTPHITLVPGRDRPIGSIVTFSRAEFRL